MNCSIYVKMIQLRFVSHIWSRLHPINGSPKEIRHFFSSNFYIWRNPQPFLAKLHDIVSFILS